MSQTVGRSWVEAWSNIVIGFCINFVANLIILLNIKPDVYDELDLKWAIENK